MAAFSLFILLVYQQLLSCLSYSYCFDDPMDVMPGNHIDNIFVGDVLEISFELKISSQCITTNCMILNIGNKDEDRFPLISIHQNNNLDVSFSTNSYWNDSYLINNTYLSSTMFDGNYHKMYFKFSDTDRIFIFDDNITYKNITNSIYDSSNTIYAQYPLWIVDSTSNPINGTIQNLCINSSIYRSFKSSQIANQSLISQSVVLPMTPYHNGAKVEILSTPETLIMNNRGYEWNIDGDRIITNRTGFDLKISFNDSMKWNFNEQLTSSIQLIMNSNHENATIDQDLLVSFSISSNKYISTIIHTDNNGHNSPYYFANNRVYPATNTSCSLNTGYYAIGDIGSIASMDDGLGLVKKTMGGQQQYDNGDIFQPPNYGLFNNSYPLIFTLINYPHKNQSILTLKNGNSNIPQFCGYAEIIKPDDDLSIYIASADRWERHGFSSFILNKYNIPTLSPTYSPTTSIPTINPTTSMPSINPSKTPTLNPTENPTLIPTKNPTLNPTLNPTKHPTQNPTKYPTKYPSETPTLNPTKSPINEGAANSVNPTKSPKGEDVNSMDNKNFFDKWKVYIMIIIILLLISCLIIICIKLYCHKKQSKEEKGGMELARITSESINKNNDNKIWTELQQSSPRSTININEESDVFGNQNALKMWLNNINMMEYYDIFIEQGFGEQMAALSTLNDNDLQQIGIKKLAHRKAILLQVDQMNMRSNTNTTNTTMNNSVVTIDVDGEININDLELPKENEQKEYELIDDNTNNELNAGDIKTNGLNDDEELYRKPSIVTIGNDTETDDGNGPNGKQEIALQDNDENTDSNNTNNDNDELLYNKAGDITTNGDV